MIESTYSLFIVLCASHNMYQRERERERTGMSITVTASSSGCNWIGWYMEVTIITDTYVAFVTKLIHTELLIFHCCWYLKFEFSIVPVSFFYCLFNFQFSFSVKSSVPLLFIGKHSIFMFDKLTNSNMQKEGRNGELSKQQAFLIDGTDEPDLSTLITDSLLRIYELLTIRIPHLHSTMTNRLIWNRHVLLL